jgi:spermidine synthase
MARFRDPLASDDPISAPSAGVALPFGLLVLLGSFLLFQVELLMARLLLPTFGSSASVWTTCLMFYQGALFAGYLYADRASAWIAAGRYRWAHVALALVPVAFFPFDVQPLSLPPVAAILVALVLTAGVPFVALSTTSVVAQAWFTTTRHPKRRDPYFLYGLSNAGALLALLTYPFLIEPRLTLPVQLSLWYAGYAVFVLLNAWCVRVLPPRTSPAPEDSASASATPSEPIAWSSRLSWLLLSAGANALLMVVTAVVSLDAPVPLVWILPLTLYLVTLIVCFAPTLPSERTVRRWNLAGMAAALAMLAAMAGGLRPELAILGLQNMILFVACLMAHDRLVRSKPADPRRLGTFFLSISLGGWLGSVAIGVATPLLFGWLASHAADFAVAGTLLLAAFAASDLPGWAATWRRRPLRGFVVVAVVAVAVAAIGSAAVALGGGSLYGARTFYGLYRVRDEGGRRLLYHGSTVHGVESLDPALRGRPLAYYHEESPIGRFFALHDGAPTAGIVGLGVGALAAYRRSGQDWDYFEIDSEVENIARRYFSFLGTSPAGSRVILGDARLSLQKIDDARYDVLVMDTFSSDFVPLHLVTRESVALYLAKLKPDGVLFFHISNRLFDLKPVLARLAEACGATLVSAHGEVAPAVSEATGRFSSDWVAITRDEGRRRRLIDELGWKPEAGDPGRAPWTDDFVNLFEAIR